MRSATALSLLTTGFLLSIPAFAVASENAPSDATEQLVAVHYPMSIPGRFGPPAEPSAETTAPQVIEIDAILAEEPEPLALSEILPFITRVRNFNGVAR